MTSSRDPIFLYYRPAFFCGFQLDAAGKPEVLLWFEHPEGLVPKYDPSQACAFDLTKTPCNLDDWDLVSVDDHANSPTFGYTTIGPLFPHAYGAAGIYLSQSTAKASGAIARKPVTAEKTGSEGRTGAAAATDGMVIAPVPPDETAIVTWNEQTRKPIRYHGFRGLLLHREPSAGNGSPVPSPPSLWVVCHPGAPVTRAPRKLWIPDNSIFSPDAMKNHQHYIDTMQSIHLEQDFATYVAELDVPKRPSGSGEALSTMLSASNASPFFPRPPNLNVMSNVVSGELTSIAAKLAPNLLTVLEGETLFDALTRYLADPRRKKDPQTFKSLDIIGHSRSGDMILKLGELALTPKVVKDQFSRLADEGVLESLGIEQIRLLGCRTGCHPRGRQVVENISECYPELDVYAARGDLFSVHYNGDGLDPAAMVLLADYDVITTSGPGDPPPSDDYPTVSRATGPVLEVPESAPPERFSIATLSDPNAATMSARSYVFWKSFHKNFEAFASLIHVNSPIHDNALVRADCEILVAVAVRPTATSDFRSFDLIRDRENPRVRIYAGGTAYAFPFKRAIDDAVLAKLGIEQARSIPEQLSLITDAVGKEPTHSATLPAMSMTS